MKINKIAISTMFALSTFLTSAYADLDIKNISADGEVSVTLNMVDQQFAATGGCNVIVGGVEINEADNFVISRNLATTLMACGEELETMSQRITSFLENTPKVVRQEQKLFLVGTVTDEKESVYIPVVLDKGEYKDISAEEYKRIFIYVSNEKTACPSDPKKECLQIKTDKQGKWEPFEGIIEGFSPEDDITYRLRLKEYNKGTEDQRWVFDMAVEQEIVQ